MRPKSIHGECNCDVSIEPLQSETYTEGVTIRRDEFILRIGEKVSFWAHNPEFPFESRVRYKINRKQKVISISTHKSNHLKDYL